MSYVGQLGRPVVHDADAHVMETPDWLQPHADPAWRDRLALRGIVNDVGATEDTWAEVRERHRDEEFRAAAGEQVMLRKNWWAPGSFLAEDRPAALDAMGFASQLVFNTFTSGALVKAEQSGDIDLAYAMAEAHDRAMIEFCSVDPRLLPVCYVPLCSLDRAGAAAATAVERGAKALMVASACPPGHSPSHVALDPVWAVAQEAQVPVVFHVGGGGVLLDPHYFVNGLPPVPDFHGGDGNFRSVDYMAIPNPVMLSLGTMIIDGVLERFPELRIGVIEQGASWVPGWMRSLDSAADAFRKNEARLQALSLKPSEYVRRQVRVTPYPHEDAGWVIEQAGREVCLFSSDFPHVEGGRHPLGRFERSLATVDDDAKEHFYRTNFEDLMGPHVPTAVNA
jgi:uncharacterized protein